MQGRVSWVSVLNLGMLNKTLDPKWEIPNGDTHTPASGDPLIPENKESYVAFDAGFGLYYKAEKYYASLIRNSYKSA